MCMNSKVQRHKPYNSLQCLLIQIQKGKDFSIDFVTGVPKNKDWREVEYNLILVIIDQLPNMVHYKPVFTTLNIEQLAEVLIKRFIKYHALPDGINTD